MKKIGFVTPWYGENIPGGAEAELRGITAHLHQAGVEIEILTTCVKEFMSDWNKKYYPVGEDIVNGVVVRRFPVRKRDIQAFDQVNYKLMNNYTVTPEEEAIFLKEMINSPDLYEYIHNNSEKYSLFVFIPYMFGTTYYGIKACPDKAVILPCFHDEAYLYLERFKETFRDVVGVIYNARPEMILAEKVYGFDPNRTKSILMGIGMDTDINGDAEKFRRNYNIQKPFILYAGRKDEGKNVHTLLNFFAEYKKNNNNELQLVLIGGGDIAIPNEVKQDVHDLGFVNQQDKYDAYSAAMLLCQPSKNESFSLVIMESWLCGRPVLVHDDCAVTKNFAIESNGGLYFKDYDEFEACVEYLMQNKHVADLMGENGGSYVKNNFSWDVITKKYIDFFAEIVGEKV